MQQSFATIQYAGDDFFVGTTPSGHSQVIDINYERGSATRPFELVQVALGGCTGADVISVLKKKRQDVTAYRVEVHATRRDEHPRTYQRIEVKHFVRGRGISEPAVAQAVQLSTDKYCAVINSLRPTAEIVATWVIEQEPAA